MRYTKQQRIRKHLQIVADARVLTLTVDSETRTFLINAQFGWPGASAEAISSGVKGIAGIRSYCRRRCVFPESDRTPFEACWLRGRDLRFGSILRGKFAERKYPKLPSPRRAHSGV